jgi:pimeloyl-ACP methyl ester carboxylesterase
VAVVNLGGGLAGRLCDGDGAVVLWIHGYTADSTLWRELWEALPGRRHIGLDLPGHGNSLPLDAGEPLDVLARRIGDVARERDVRHVVAQSLGGVIALQMALEHAGAFETLALGAPVLGGGPFAPDLWARYAEVKAEFADSGHSPALVDRWMARGASLFRGLDRRPALELRMRAQVARHPWWEFADDAYLELWQTPQKLHDLERIGLPTVVVVGDDAPAVLQSADFLERLLPECRRVELPGTGHACLAEEPARAASILERHWSAGHDRALATHGAVDRAGAD